MKEIYPDGYLQKKHEEQSSFKRYIHGVKFALFNGIFWKWHYNIIKLWLKVKYGKK